MTYNLNLKDITEIIYSEEKYIFSIPSYQRGYRWEKDQINELLEDLKEFIHKKNFDNKISFYCLQPLVVYKKNNEYIVVDGQQRLTTMLLLIKYLGITSKYNIIYTTHNKLDLDKLKNDNDDGYCDNKNRDIDSYCIYLGKEKIKEWFEKLENKGQKDNFKDFISKKDNLKFIWYELNSNDEKKEQIDQIISFNNLNKTKIKLTNSEIIKAIFILNSKKNKDINIESILYRWDYMEQKLQDDRFWFFLTNGEVFDTRIDLIFDLAGINRKKYENFNNNELNINSDWSEIKKVFNRCLSWYEDNKLYHYIGFLITNNNKIIKTINEKWESNKTYTENLQKIKEKIKKLIVGYPIGDNKKIKEINDIDDLDYETNKDLIKKIFLLFNIETHISTCKYNNEQNYIYYRFPFELYKKEHWDIEHLDSQTENPLIKNSDKQQWLKFLQNLSEQDCNFKECKEYIEIIKKDLKEQNYDIDKIISKENKYFEKEDLIKIYRKNYENTISNSIEQNNWHILQLKSVFLYYFLEDKTVSLKEEFDKFYELIIEIFKGDDNNDKHNIGNLTLLDSKTNRGYGNALFPTKRQEIIKKDSNGSFIPICTKNLFLKYYTKESQNVSQFNNKWNEIDRKSYLNEIKEKIKWIFKEV